MTADTIHAPTGAMLRTLAARLTIHHCTGRGQLVEAGSSDGADEALHRGAGALVASDGDRTAVWLSGEHDLASTVLLTTALAQAMAVEDDDVVVDMTFLSFMDVTTLGLLLRSHEFLVTRGRRLTVRAPPRCAKILLDVSELAGLVEPTPEPSNGKRRHPRVANALATWVAVPPTKPAPPAAHPQDERNDPDVARPMSEP